MTGDRPLDEAVLVAFGDELVRMSRRRLVVPAGSELDLSAFRILRQLADDGPRTLRELGDALELEQSTISRQTAAVIRRGLAERVSVPDQTTHAMQITSAGRQVYRHDLELRGALYRRALESLGADGARRLTDDLAAFNNALDRGLA